MRKQFQIAIMSGVAMVLLPLAPATAWTQPPTIDQEAQRASDRLRGIRELEGFLAEAEAARLAGRCDTVRAWHGFFHGTNPNFTLGDSVAAELREIFRRRIDEIAAQDCPPGSGRPSITLAAAPPAATQTTGSTPGGQPAPDPDGILDEIGTDIGATTTGLPPRPTAPDASPPPASSPDTSDPSFIRGQMSVALQACNRARFEELKRRLIASLDRRIGEATDEFTRGRLMRERELAEAAAMPQPCPPVSPAPAPQAPAVAPGTAAPVGSVGSAATTGLPRRPEPSPSPPPASPDTSDPELSSRLADLGPRAVRGVPEPSADPALWGDYFYVSGGYGETEAPAANYGFLRDGPSGAAPERPAGFSEERVETLGFGLGLTLPRIGQFSFGYGEGSAGGRFDIPVLGGGGASGIVNTAESPSGSTGVTGDFGTTGTSDVSVRSFEGGYRYSFFDLPPTGWVEEPRVRFAPFVGVAGAYRERDHQAQLDIATTLGSGFQVQVRQQLDQSVDETEFGAVAGVEAVVPLGPGVRIDFAAEAGVYYYDFDLSSLETRTQNIGPASDRSFTNRIEDNESGVGYSGTVQVGLGIAVDRQIELFIAGKASYFSDRAQVVNPFSGDFVLDGGTTFLGTDEAVDWRAMIGLRYVFGAPPSR